MTFTIGIPTFNRSEFLGRTLSSLLDLVEPAGADYEILVVDNNCTDKTTEVIGALKPQFKGRLRSVKEQRQGLSCCRNRIIEESRADVVAYLDDDVNVDSRWLLSLANAYSRWDDAAAIGGKVYLIFENECPAWLGAPEAEKLSELDLGGVPILLEANQFLFGLNFSFKRHLASQIGSHRLDLGRIGRRLLSGEEIEYQERIRGAGGKIYYDPQILVGHYVPEERLSKRWFLERIFWEGRGEVRSHNVNSKDSPNAMWHAIYSIVGTTCMIPFGILRYGFSSPKVFQLSKKIARMLGVLTEICSIAISRQ